MAWNDGFQVWLTEEQSLENAQLIVNYFFTDGSDWTKESLSAMLGNMRHESSVNPNMYEYGYDWEDDRGYGLVQWTPRSKYWDWAVDNGLDPESPDSQLARIDYEVENNIQWIPTSEIENMTFEQFRTNSGGWSLDFLTSAFTWGYERPNRQAGEESMPARRAFAQRCFNELNWEGAPQPDDTIGKVLTIVGNGKDSILTGINTAFDEVEIPDIDLNELFKGKLFKNSETFYSNNLLKATIIFNMLKINPTSNFNVDLDFNQLLEELNQNIHNVVNNGFDNMIDQIQNIDDNPSPSNKYFPVNYNESGVNFWKKSNYSLGDLQYEMCYGWVRNGGNTFHSGYDIGSGGVTGLGVYATNNGEITISQWSDSLGYFIQIKHEDDDYYSTYGHLVNNSNVFNVGDKVKAGDRIATMGNTPSGAVHLHYILSKDGSTSGENNTFDPEPYLEVTGDNATNLPAPS